MGIYSIYHQLYSDNRRDCGVCFADTVFADNRPIVAAADFNRRRTDSAAGYIRQHTGTKIHGQDAEPVDIGDIDKPGILGDDLGNCRNVFQCAVTGCNIHHHGAI